MKKYVLSCLFFTCFFGLSAQDFPYQLEVESRTYQDLEGAIQITDDEPWEFQSYIIPSEFEFEYLNIPFHKIFNYYFGMSFTFKTMSADTTEILVLYGSIIQDRGLLGNASLSPISYKITGEEGNKILTIEYKNAGFEAEIDQGFSNSYINLQASFYQENNMIELHIGDTFIDENSDVHDGGSGPIIAFVDEYNEVEDTAKGFWFVTGDILNPEIEYQIFDEEEEPLYLDDDPVSNTVYRFIPQTVSVKGLESKKIFTIYPTVTNDYLILSSENYYSNEINKLFITDKMGRRFPVSDMKNRKVDVSGLQPGVYFLTMITHQGIHSKKFVKI